ncbi:MAG: hypothetical protein AAF575_14435, partial [Bacteroidota bacterium]
MNSKIKTIIGSVFVFTAPILVAQKTDSTRIAEPEVLSLPAVNTDSIGQIQDVSRVSSQLNELVTEREKAEFELKDLEETRTYDSLWLKELSKSADWFAEMYMEVQNETDVKKVEIDLPTDTLKVRLAKLNEK